MAAPMIFSVSEFSFVLFIVLTWFLGFFAQSYPEKAQRAAEKKQKNLCASLRLLRVLCVTRSNAYAPSPGGSSKLSSMACRSET